MERIIIEKLPSVENEEKKRHLVRYVNFINSRPERDLKQKGFEMHHIYPKSIAKKNNIDDFNGNWNLIELTHREHFIAHLILWKCGYKEMIYAYFLMTHDGCHSFKINSRLYGKLKTDYSECCSKRGSENSFFGKTHSEETCRKIVNKRRETMSLWTDEQWKKYGENLTKSNKGKKRSEEIKQKISKGKMGNKSNLYKIRISKDNKNKFIDKSLLNNYLSDGWVLGFSKNTDGPIKNKKAMNNGIINKYVKIDEVEFYINEGWVFGFKKDVIIN